MTSPTLSVVVLTLNERRNIEACLGSLAAQTDTGFEVVLVDAASTDGTVAAASAIAPHLPFPLRIHASGRRLPIGEARNLGVQMARAPRVAFLSADAELDPHWVAQAGQALERHDVVFGAQEHVPRRWTAAAAARGLRYHFPDGPTDDPLRYASNVAAAYRRDVLLEFPFDAWSDAAEDLLLARRAAKAGRSIHYDPEMKVLHHDVEDARQEWRKNVREGRGWALYRHELGLLLPVLAWGGALGLAVLQARRSRVAVGALAAVLWAPALRRAWRRRGHIPPAAAAAGVLVSPAYDLAFLYHYVRALAARPADPARKTEPRELTT